MISVRVSDIRQFSFCPRVIWHRVLIGQPTSETPKMAMGRDAEAALTRLERRRQLHRYGFERATRRFGIFLESETLGMHGICDLVLDVPSTTKPRTYPVEVKTTRGGVGYHHVLQLTAYAMLLEDNGSPTVDEGFVLLLPSDRIHVVQIGPDERAEVRRVLDAIRNMFETQRFPPPTRYRSFCPDCEYVNFCGDVL